MTITMNVLTYARAGEKSAKVKQHNYSVPLRNKIQEKTTYIHFQQDQNLSFLNAVN